MKDTVVILGAGPGKRLGNLTKNFNKAFIRIGDVGAISHIINYFHKDYKFVIVTGYLGDELEQYVKICHPDLDCKFVRTNKYEGPQSGPGYALLQARPHITGSFYLWTVDTLVENFNLQESGRDWIGYAKADNGDGEYSCVELNKNNIVTNFYEKQDKTYTNNAYIGCAYILNSQTFWEGLEKSPVMVQNQYQVSAGFYQLLKAGVVVEGKELEWYDTGNLEKLQNTREQFPAKIQNLDKDDEELYFFNDKFVVKYFKDSVVAQNRVKRNKILGNTVPKILLSSKNFYAYEYTEGKDLFNIDNPQDHLLNLLNFANDNLWQEKKLNPEEFRKFQESCLNFYYKKTKNRLDKLYEKLHLYDKEDTINGVKIPPLNDILNSLDWQKLLNGKPTLMHGDFNFSNIVLQSDETFKLIDWRQDFDGMIEVGDMYYDLAKLYSGLIFPHDIIKEKKFTFSLNHNKIEVTSFVSSKYIKCEKILFNFLKNKNIDIQKVKQLASLVLLNMSPLHEFPLNVYLYFFGKYLLYETVNEK